MAKLIDIIVAGKYTGQDQLGKAKRDVDALEGGTQKAAGGFRAAGAMMGAALVGVGVALGAVAGAAKLAWAELERGAQLSRTADQFDNLARSIDSTAEAMLGKLREATGGMMSDAALMESAAGIMSLGLAKTEDGVVRLATVVGELGWDMQQVILTMANNSKMRLDALGLSVEDVTDRAKKLQEAGMSMDQAFDLAVIEAGEAKIKLVGSAADTTAGQIKMLITQWQNARDEFSRSFVEELADDLGLAAGNADALGEGLQAAAGAAAEFAAGPIGAALNQIASFGQQSQFNKLVDQFLVLGGSMSVANDLQADMFKASMTGWFGDLEAEAEVIERVSGYIDHILDRIAHENPELKFLDMSKVKEQAEYVAAAYTRIGDATREVTQQLDAYYVIGDRAANVNRQIAEETGYTVYELAQMGVTAEEVAKQQEEAAEKQRQALEELTQHYRDAALAMSGAFSAALQDGGMPDFGNADAMRDAAFGMAEAFGLTAPVLADIGVQMGVIDEKTAEAAGKAALFQGAMQVLLGQLASGAIDPTQFTTAVDELITNLENNTVVELQVDLKARQESIDDIRNMDWLPDAAQEGLIKNAGLEITVADEALREALDLIDGVPDNDEKIVTFTPEAEEVFDVIDEITVAIPEIPGTVTFVPEAYQVDQKINDLNRTRVTIYVDYVPTGAPTGAPAGGGGGGAPTSTPRGGGGKGTSSVAELIREIQREGVAW
jgi:hypothetical protein